MDKHVYKAIGAITQAMSREGIAKSRRNTQGAGYNFRGIDDVLNSLSGLLAEHQLCIIPRVVSREQVERQSKQGGALFYTCVEVEFDLVSAVDGSIHVARMAGEAMDSSDKSTNKAMSAAYKYMALQVFCIPTEGDNDTENHTHEVAARPVSQPIIKPLSDEELDDCCIAIQDCPDMDALKGIFTAAYKRAGSQQRTILEAAKEKRKNELTTEKKAA